METNESISSLFALLPNQELFNLEKPISLPPLASWLQRRTNALLGKNDLFSFAQQILLLLKQKAL